MSQDTPNNAHELHELFEQARILGAWSDFTDKLLDPLAHFLGELNVPPEDREQAIVFTFVQKNIEASRLTQLFWHYVRHGDKNQPDFYQVLRTWWLDNGHTQYESQFPLVYQHYIKQLKDNFTDDNWVIREQNGQLNNGKAGMLAARIQRFVAIVNETLEYVPEEKGELGYQAQVIQQLNQAKETLQSSIDGLHRALNAEPAIKFDSTELSGLEQQAVHAYQASLPKGSTADPQKEQAIIETTRRNVEAAIAKHLEPLKLSYQNFIDSIKDRESKHQKVSSLERQYELNPITDLSNGQQFPGLLEATIQRDPSVAIPDLDLNKSTSSSAFLYNFFYRIVHLVNTDVATADTNLVVDRHTKGVADLIKLCSEELEKQQAEVKAKIIKEIQLGFSPSSPGPVDAGGGAEETPEETPTEEKPAKPPLEPETPIQPPAQPVGTESLDDAQQQALLVANTAKAKSRLMTQITASIGAELSSLNQKLNLGLSEADINTLIAQQNSQLSQDLWYKLLEAGALTGDRPYTSVLADIWSNLSDEYLQRIIVSQERINTILSQQDGYNQNNPRFFREWLRQQEEKTVVADISPEDATALDPRNVAAALTSARNLETIPLDGQLRNYILSRAGVTGPDAEAFINQLFEHLNTVRSSQDGGAVQDAYNRILTLLALDNDQQLPDADSALGRIRALLFSAENADPLLYSLFFSVPELNVASQYVAEFQKRWQGLAQKALLSPEIAKRAQYFQRLPDFSPSAQEAEQAQPVSSARYAPPELNRTVDFEFSLNLIFSSDLERPQQDAVETTLYTYYVLNRGQEIPLDRVLLMINNAGMLGVDDSGNIDPQAWENYNQGLYAGAGAVPATDAGGLQARQAVQQQRNAMAAKMSQMQAIMGAAKIAGYAATGQWHLAAKEFLTNKALQKEVKKQAEKLKKVALPLAGLSLAIPIGIVASMLKPLIDLINTISGIVSGIRNFFTGSEAVDAYAGRLAGARNELTAASRNATSLAKAATTGTTEAVSYGAAQAGIGKSLLAVLAASTAGPLFTVVLLTIIVITVIGGSINDLPSGFALEGYIRRGIGGMAGCWPTTGYVSFLPESPGHRTWMKVGTAVDISGERGTEIYATFAGTARFITGASNTYGVMNGGYGNMVVLDTDLGFRLYFAHMEASNLSPGETVRVSPGDLIGFMGNSGTGVVHLHYESIDPKINIRTLLPSDPPFTFYDKVDPYKCAINMESDLACFQFVGGEKEWDVSEETGIRSIISLLKNNHPDTMEKLCSDGPVKVIRDGPRTDAGTPYGGITYGRTIHIFDFCFDASQADCQFTFTHELAHVISNSTSTGYLFTQLQHDITSCSTSIIHSYPLVPPAGEMCSENFAESFMLFTLQSYTSIKTARCLPEAPNTAQYGEGSTCEPFDFAARYPQYYNFWNGSL